MQRKKKAAFKAHGLAELPRLTLGFRADNAPAPSCPGQLSGLQRPARIPRGRSSPGKQKAERFTCWNSSLRTQPLCLLAARDPSNAGGTGAAKAPCSPGRAEGTGGSAVETSPCSTALESCGPLWGGYGGALGVHKAKLVSLAPALPRAYPCCPCPTSPAFLTHLLQLAGLAELWPLSLARPRSVPYPEIFYPGSSLSFFPSKMCHTVSSPPDKTGSFLLLTRYRRAARGAPPARSLPSPLLFSLFIDSAW